MSEYLAVQVHQGSTVTMKSMPGMTLFTMRLESGLMLMKLEFANHMNLRGMGSACSAAL